MARMAETDHSLLVMLGDFLFNGKHISFGVVRNLDICNHRGGARPDRNMLALFYNIHQLVIIPFNGCLKGTYIIV